MRDTVIGLDLSLTSTGVAGVSNGTGWADRIKTPGKLGGCERLRWILDHIHGYIQGARLVLIEGPSYGSANGQSGHHERAGLWWIVTYRLWQEQVTTVTIPPTNLKMYATGKGNASKDAVLAAAIRRYPDVQFDGNDQADGLILAAIGADHLGFPLANVPAKNRAALAAIQWPLLTAVQ